MRGHDHAASGRAGGAARHLRRHRLRARSRAPALARRHRHRAHAGALLRRRPPSDRQGAAQLLGLQHARILRAGAALCLEVRGRPSEVVREFKQMVKDLHNAGHRGHPGRGVQPHRRGQPRGPDAVVSRHRQSRLLPHHAGRSALLHGFHRLRQHAQHAASARDPAAHGQPALLGDRDARGRLPLRSRLGARARAEGRGPARRVLRHDLSGSDARAREAHRRALGSRRGRLSGRQFPAGLDGVERQVPRHGAQVLEGRHGPSLRDRDAARRQRGPLREPRGARPRRASISSPPTTGSRCRIW